MPNRSTAVASSGPLRWLLPALALLALLAGGFWLLQEDEAAPLPGAPGTANAAAADRASAAGADLAPAAADDADVAAALAATGPRTAAAVLAGGPMVSGQVVDERGTPVAGAVVRLSPQLDGSSSRNFDWRNWEEMDPAAMAERVAAVAADRIEVTTDTAGRFQAPAPTSERGLALRVLGRKFQLLDRNLPRLAGEDLELGQLVLRQAAAVSGRVVDRAGAPVAGARVQRTAAARSGGEPEGGMRMRFGGMPDFGDMDMAIPGSEFFGDLALGENQAITDAAGRFALPHCEPGEFALRARHPEHPLARLDGLSVAPGGELAGISILVEPGASIRGRILGVPEGQPALRVVASLVRERDSNAASAGPSAMFVNLMQDVDGLLAESGFGFGERQIDTDDEYGFELRGLQAGKTYRVWAVPNGRGIAGNAICTQRLEVAAGSRGVELRYEAGIAVRFRVRAKEGGAPVEQLFVREQLRGGGGMADMMAMIPRGGRSKRYPGGEVQILNLRPRGQQRLSLVLEAVGFGRYERSDIELPNSGELDLGEIELAAAPVVEVLVRGADGRPAAGANVQLRGAREAGPGGNPFQALAGGNFDPAQLGAQMERLAAAMPFGGGAGSGASSGRTDAAGRVLLNALAGEMSLRVSSEDWAPYSSEPFVAAATGVTTQSVQLLRGGIVEVLVLDSDGEPLPQARVEHESAASGRATQTADAAGKARFSRLPPGEHRFRLASSAGGRGQVDVMMTPWGNATRGAEPEIEWQLAVVVDGQRSTLELRKAATAKLRGVIRENGLPLAGARIAFLPGEVATNPAGGLEARFAEMAAGVGGRSARSGEDGSYELRELPAGRHRLRITTAGRAQAHEQLVELRLGDNLVDVVLASATLRGVVKDSAGEPVRGAQISIVAGEDSATADPAVQAIETAFGAMLPAGGAGGGRTIRSESDGSFEVRGVEPGSRLRIRATARGLAPATSAVVEVPLTGELAGIEIRLASAGRLQVEVADAPRLAAVVAEKLTDDGQRDTAVAPITQQLRGGRVTLDGLLPGQWRVTMRGLQGGQRAPALVTVTAGATATLNL